VSAYDVLVLGAGPAGSALARRLASAGARVALIGAAYPEATRGGDEDDDEQDDRRSQGHHRDGVGWRSFGDVLVHLLPHVGRPAG